MSKESGKERQAGEQGEQRPGGVSKSQGNKGVISKGQAGSGLVGSARVEAARVSKVNTEIGERTVVKGERTEHSGKDVGERGQSTRGQRIKVVKMESSPP